MYEIAFGRELPANGPGWNEIRNGNLDSKVLSSFLKPIRQLISLMMHPDPQR